MTYNQNHYADALGRNELEKLLTGPEFNNNEVQRVLEHDAAQRLWISDLLTTVDELNPVAKIGLALKCRRCGEGAARLKDGECIACLQKNASDPARVQSLPEFELDRVSGELLKCRATAKAWQERCSEKEEALRVSVAERDTLRSALDASKAAIEELASKVVASRPYVMTELEKMAEELEREIKEATARLDTIKRGQCPQCGAPGGRHSMTCGVKWGLTPRKRDILEAVCPACGVGLGKIHMPGCKGNPKGYPAEFSRVIDLPEQPVATSVATCGGCGVVFPNPHICGCKYAELHAVEIAVDTMRATKDSVPAQSREFAMYVQSLARLFGFCDGTVQGARADCERDHPHMVSAMGMTPVEKKDGKG